jgi:adenylate cyclase
VRIPGVRVTARTSSFASSKGKYDVRRIGARLGTAWVVEGSVRRAGGRVRVSAQLVSARDGFHAWSERYDRHFSGIFGLQDEIALSIAEALKLKLKVAPVRQRLWNPAAYDLWVKGRSISQQYTP